MTIPQFVTFGSSLYIMREFLILLTWNIFAISKGIDSISNVNNDHMASGLQRQVPDGAMGYLLQYPELTMEPNLEGYDNTVVFKHGDANTYKNYMNRMEHVFKTYNTENYDTKDCTNMTWFRPRNIWNKACRFDPAVELTDPGHLCSQHYNYGFPETLPCIVIGLDRVLNWLPEPYTNETVPEEIRGIWRDGSIAVTCEGTDPVSVDNIQQIETFPEKGFSYKYFPNIGQSNWRTPLVQVVVFVARGVAVEIRCTAWSSNIFHSDLISTGSVKFTILEF